MMNITANDGSQGDPSMVNEQRGTFTPPSGIMDPNMNGMSGPNSAQISVNQSMSLIHTSTLTSQYNTAAAGAVALPQQQLMFSGFGSHKQEGIYDKLVEKAFSLMTQRLLSMMHMQMHDSEVLAFQTWGKQILKIWRYLEVMDKQKWTMPKMSTALQPLIQFIRDKFQQLGRSDSAGGSGSLVGSELGTFRQFFSNTQQDESGSIRNVVNPVSEQHTRGSTKQPEATSTRKVTAVPSNRVPGLYKVRRIEIKKDLPQTGVEMLNLSQPIRGGQKFLPHTINRQLFNDSITSSSRHVSPSVKNTFVDRKGSSTKRRIHNLEALHLNQQDFEKMFSEEPSVNLGQQHELYPRASTTQTGVIGGRFFIKDGKYCTHRHPAQCNPTCFDYLTQVRQLQKAQRGIPDLGSAQVMRRSKNFRDSLQAGVDPNFQVAPIQSIQTSLMSKLNSHRKAQSQPRGGRLLIRQEDPLVSGGATILQSKNEDDEDEEQEPQQPNIHVLSDGRVTPSEHNESRHSQIRKKLHSSTSGTRQAQHFINDQQLSQISSRSSHSSTVGGSPGKHSHRLHRKDKQVRASTENRGSRSFRLTLNPQPPTSRRKLKSPRALGDDLQEDSLNIGQHQNSNMSEGEGDHIIKEVRFSPRGDVYDETGDQRLNTKRNRSQKRKRKGKNLRGSTQKLKDFVF